MATEIIVKDQLVDIAKLPKRDFEIARTVYEFNKLRSFKLSTVEILEWKDSILKLMPDIDANKLMFVIEKMMDGTLEYDHNLGIQNIFRGLKKVELFEGTYRVKLVTPWS